MKKLLTFLTLALFGIAGSRTVRASFYQIDNGSAETETALHDASGAPTDFIAMNHFNVTGGNDMIGQVQIAWGSPFSPDPTLNGLSYTVAIWSDPNGDGDPSDATLLAQAPGVITNADTNTFDVTLFNCVQVPQSFFVGFLITVNNQNPAGVDLNGGYTQDNFVAAATFGNGNITNLTSNNLLPVTAAGNVGIAGNFLIRADLWVVPEPRSSALLICGGMIALLVWRRRVGKLRRPCPKLWPFAF
ncbi:MAG TPA: hypothetical protein VGG02_07665 [Chthoniobacterales bacterium]|jgi:hypothetical protein